MNTVIDGQHLDVPLHATIVDPAPPVTKEPQSIEVTTEDADDEVVRVEA